MSNKRQVRVLLRKPHNVQRAFQTSLAKRKVVRGGRRGGKTVGLASYSVDRFVNGRLRILYTAPTADQLQTYWFEVKRALREPIEAGLFVKNESDHSITLAGTKQRIRAKTAWNADTLRGDYSDVLIFDEYQLMDPDAWTEVGAPMLLDNDGEAVFIYTPPKPHDKAVGYRHAAALFKKAEKDTLGEWAAFHFTSHDNPYISKEALSRIARDMTIEGYKREILAEDSDEVTGALWTRKLIEETRVDVVPDSMDRIVVGVDPPGGATECGIVIAGRKDGHTYVFGDDSLLGTPETWANAVYKLGTRWQADQVVGERNYGGDMVKSVLRPFLKNSDMRYRDVNATRGKAVRAEPVVASFERGETHIVGSLSKLEDELCTWIPGSNRARSPNRLDAMVWACTELDRPSRRRGSVAFG